MFSEERNGYSKHEVDLYIKGLKAKHEENLLEAKLRALEAEKKVHDMKMEMKEMDRKESSIRSALDAIERATRVQKEGTKNLYNLKSEQMSRAFSKLDEFLADLTAYPELQENSKIKLEILDLQNISESFKQNIQAKTALKEDASASFRTLLDRMQTQKSTQPKTAQIVRTSYHPRASKDSQIKPITDTVVEAGENYASPLEKFLNTADDNSEKDKLYKRIDLESNSFNIAEALNPQTDLEDIMKSFDFFNNSNPEEEKKRLKALEENWNNEED